MLACSPEIFGEHPFGSLVVTHFLAVADLHGHRATVFMDERPFRMQASIDFKAYLSNYLTA